MSAFNERFSLCPPSTFLSLPVMSFEALRQSFQPMAFHLGEVSRAEPADPHLALGSLPTATHQLAWPGWETVSWTPDQVANPEVSRLRRNHGRLARTGTLCEKEMSNAGRDSNRLGYYLQTDCDLCETHELPSSFVSFSSLKTR